MEGACYLESSLDRCGALGALPRPAIPAYRPLGGETTVFKPDHIASSLW